MLLSRQAEPSPEPLELHPCVYLTTDILPAVTAKARSSTHSRPNPTLCKIPAKWNERRMNLMVVESDRESEAVGEKENEHTFVRCDNADAASLMRGPDVTQGTFVCVCVCVFIFVRFRLGVLN